MGVIILRTCPYYEGVHIKLQNMFRQKLLSSSVDKRTKR